MALRVVKLGGSLLDLPELPARLRAWLASQAPAATLLVIGGGGVVEAIRQAQRVHDLSDAACHHLALAAMGVTAAVVAELLPGVAIVGRPPDVERAEGSLQIIDARAFLAEPPGDCPDFTPQNGTVPLPRDAAPLPESWQVTSDSIAAHLAERLAADELVLLKSTLPEMAAGSLAEISADRLAATGVVDEYFPRAVRDYLAASTSRQGARAAGVRLVNLRAAHFPTVSVLASSGASSARSGLR